MKFRLLSRPECHLCRDAEDALNALGVDFVTVDVDSDPEVARRFGDAIPVLLADGAEVIRAPFSPSSLRRALERFVSLRP